MTQAVAFMECGVSMGSCLGAVLTGYVTDHWNWETAFYINGGIMIAVTMTPFFRMVGPLQLSVTET